MVGLAGALFVAMGVCPALRTDQRGHHAGIPGTTLWRPVPPALCGTHYCDVCLGEFRPGVLYGRLCAGKNVGRQSVVGSLAFGARDRRLYRLWRLNCSRLDQFLAVHSASGGWDLRLLCRTVTNPLGL